MSIFGFNVRYYVAGREEPLALREMSVAFERAGMELEQFGLHVFPKLIPVIEEEVKGQFNAEGHGPNAGKWPGLKTTYEKAKLKQAPGKKLLRRTDNLFNALTKSESTFALRTYSAKQLSFGTMGLSYASFHQTGTQKKDGSTLMQARPLFDFRPEFEKAVEKAALEGAREAIRASRLDKYTSSTAATNAVLNRGWDDAFERGD